MLHTLHGNVCADVLIQLAHSSWVLCQVLPFSTGGRAVCCTLMAMNYFLTVIWAALAASPVQGGVMGNAGLMQVAAPVLPTVYRPLV